MEDYERAVQSAMDDSDPLFVKKAMEIMESKMSYEDKAAAIWKLFEDRLNRS